MTPRLTLAAQAKIWRGLENIGMGIERWTGPTQATHSFTRMVTIEEPFLPGTVDLYFYTPPQYLLRKPKDRFPTFLNFHGGGFTIGDATDDARWARDVMRYLGAVVVSANYRLAPEYPYPVAVQDGACVLHYLAQHGENLGLDIEHIVTCGFSAGGNLCITSPMLYNALHRQETQNPYESSLAIPDDWYPEHALTWNNERRCHVQALAAFYPAVDFTLTREEKRLTNPSPSHNLSEVLTDLFDASFLPLPEDTMAPDPAMISPIETSHSNGSHKETLQTSYETPLGTPVGNPSNHLTLTPPNSDKLASKTLSKAVTVPFDLKSSDVSATALASISHPSSTTPGAAPEKMPSSSGTSSPETSSSQSRGLEPTESKNRLVHTVSSRSTRPAPLKTSSSFPGRPARPRKHHSTLSVHRSRRHHGEKGQASSNSSGTSTQTASSNRDSHSPSKPHSQPNPALFDPFLSPAQASSTMLQTLVPPDCIVYTCEWDMLQAEGERFAVALAAAGKKVCYRKVPRVAHAWDKLPGIISWGEDAARGREKVVEVYAEVCGLVGAVLGIEAKVVRDVRDERRRSRWFWGKRDGGEVEQSS